MAHGRGHVERGFARGAAQAREGVPAGVHVERSHLGARHELGPNVSPHVARVHRTPGFGREEELIAGPAGEPLVGRQGLDEPAGEGHGDGGTGDDPGSYKRPARRA